MRNFSPLFLEGEDLHPPLTKANAGDNVWVSVMYGKVCSINVSNPVRWSAMRFRLLSFYTLLYRNKSALSI
jgi:hypothetical protein